MTQDFTLALIDNAFLPTEFDAIAELAINDGHNVIRYIDNAAFFAASHDHSRIDALLCMGSTRMDAATLAKMPRLRALLSAVTGIEGFDIPAASAQGIVIGNGQTELNYTGMAEATVLLMLAALYDFNHTQAVLRDSLPRPAPLRARMLHGLTVGMIGFGKIAQETARRLAPWGITQLCYARRPDPLIAATGGVQTDLETLLRNSDIVSLHCALNPQTHHILNAEKIALMKPTAILVNASRGALVDEAALIAALSAGHIAGAALDVFEVEPLPVDSPLRGLPNVILTPHLVGHTADCNRTLMQTAWQSVQRIARGAPPIFVKNPDILPAWQARFEART